MSSCLLGEKVRYHGEDAHCAHSVLERWKAEGRIVSVCPEVAGGLSVPRPPAEIVGGDGHDVLKATACVGDRGGNDVTEAFVRGGKAALDAAKANGVALAILKDGSPSCGTSYIYDGTFRGQRAAGHGVTAALLDEAGIRVFGERQLDEADAYLQDLEARSR